MLSAINATSRDIIAVADEKKDIERRNVNAKGGDAIGKRNNKKGGTPFINYNG